ncbi:GATA zinc finger domain-containing protein 4-like [Coccinella septempunctata]|uniref:GATA zinc finger domain-containing protein 4-like n=1 Tax=Coccinella septempunctata TaxID=41139 RepID=UPI001D08CB2A|nr:GATA zinc finger domain-containing protein 4-like [Coccinella septempunctata]
METRRKHLAGSEGEETSTQKNSDTNILEVLMKMKEDFKEFAERIDNRMEENSRAMKVTAERLEDMEKRFENRMEEGFMKINEIFNERVNKTEEKIDRKMGMMIRQCQEDLETTENNIRKEVREKLDLDINKIKENIDKQNEIIQRVMIKENFSTPEIIYSDNTKWNFNGKIKKQHPVPFVRFLENKEGSFSTFRTFKEYIRNLLSEEALLWFNNKEMNLDNFSDFKSKFLDYFWGPAQQKIIKNELFSGKFNPMKGSSYHRYAMHIYSVAQYLNADFTEEYIVSLIIQHFDKDLEDVLLLYDFKNMDKLCQFLMSQEYRLRRKYIHNNNPQYYRNNNNNRQNQRNEMQQGQRNNYNYQSNNNYNNNYRNNNTRYRNQNHSRNENQMGQSREYQRGYTDQQRRSRSEEDRSDPQGNRRINVMNRQSNSQQDVRILNEDRYENFQ